MLRDLSAIAELLVVGKSENSDCRLDQVNYNINRLLLLMNNNC